MVKKNFRNECYVGLRVVYLIVKLVLPILFRKRVKLLYNI